MNSPVAVRHGVCIDFFVQPKFFTANSLKKELRPLIGTTPLKSLPSGISHSRTPRNLAAATVTDWMPPLRLRRPRRILSAYNAAVQPPRDALSSAQQAHNEMARLLRARDGVSRSAATAC